MKTKKKLLSLALALILILALTACGSASKAATMENGSAPQDAAAEELPAPSYASDQSTAGPLKLTGTGSASGTLPSSDKIIYSGSAEIETMEFDKTLEDLSKMVGDVGGFVESSNVTGTDFYTQHSGGKTYRNAQYVFRIPADQFKSFTQGLSALGNVPYSSSNAENITMAYTDIASRLQVARTKEARLLELLSKATSMEDILSIENALSDVQYQIESLSSQVKTWDSLLSYSTLSVTVREVSLYTEDSTQTLGYGQQLKEAFVRSLKATGRFFKGLFKFLVAALPVLVVLGVIAVPVVLITKKALKKRRAEAPARQSTENDGKPPFQR